MNTRLLVLVCLAGATGSLEGQTVVLPPDAQVRFVSFRVDSGPTPDDLDGVVGTSGRGGTTGLDAVLRWLPFVSPTPDRPFDPVELQRDKERLRRYFARAGYPHAAVDYAVQVDTAAGAVDVVFSIVRGPPTLVRSVELAWEDSAAARTLPALDEIRPRVTVRPGGTLDQRELTPALAAIRYWLADRGFPYAKARAVIEADSVTNEARLMIRVSAGPRARLGAIGVTGNARLSTETIRSLLDIKVGDWYSRRRLESATRDIATLDIVQRAWIEVPEQAVDTTITILLHVEEESLRSVLAQAGYTTDGGLAAEIEWTHRNALGEARTFTASLAGQSGVLATTANAEQFIRGTLTGRQPLFHQPRLSLNVGPFTEYRDDYRDRSLQFGLQTIILYQLGPLSSVALRHELSTRRIYEYRFGDISGGIDFLDLLTQASQGVLDSLGARINSNLLTLSASLGSLDIPSDPTRGFVVEPSISTSVISKWSSTEYVVGNLRASAYLPVSRSITLAVRLGGGKLIPFGKSVPPSPDEGLSEYFRLREVLLTAGGMGDVRGWASRLLGPKFPRILLKKNADSTLGFSADQYVPIGGFNQFHASVELRTPVPFVGPAWSTYVFADGGRVWTRDERFTSDEDPFGVEKFFWAIGTGLDYETPIGAVRIALAYKMNPSALDLVTPEDLTRAILSGSGPVDLNALPTHQLRRFHIHIGLGRRL